MSQKLVIKNKKKIKSFGHLELKISTTLKKLNYCFSKMAYKALCICKNMEYITCGSKTKTGQRANNFRHKIQNWESQF